MAPIMKAIAASYSSVYDFATDVYEKGASAAEKVGIPEKAALAYNELVQASFKPSIVAAKAEVRASSLKPNGIADIKSVLSGFENVSIKYLGAPRYMLTIEDESFKKANKRMSATLDSMEKKAKPLGVALEYEIMKNERNPKQAEKVPQVRGIHDAHLPLHGLPLDQRPLPCF